MAESQCGDRGLSAFALPACCTNQSLGWSKGEPAPVVCCVAVRSCLCPACLPAPVISRHALGCREARHLALARQFHPNDGCLDSLYLTRTRGSRLVPCTSPTCQMRDRVRLGCSQIRGQQLPRYLPVWPRWTDALSLCVRRLRDPSTCGENSVHLQLGL